MPARLVLIHTSCHGSFDPETFGAYRWIYLGVDYLMNKELQKCLGEAAKVTYKKRLQSASYALRDDFVRWSADLGREHWHDWKWWITTLAARNTQSSSLYLDICYIEVLKEILPEVSGTLLVVSEDWDLLGVIEDNFRKEHQVSWIRRNNAARSTAKEVALFVLRWGRFFQKSMVEWVAARLTGARRRFDDDLCTVIHTCIDDYCLGEMGDFKDRYYPGLAHQLRLKGKRVYTLAWVCNVKKMGIFSLFRWFRSAKEPILIPQDYYGPMDCLVSFVQTMRSGLLPIDSRKCRFKEIDYRRLVTREQRLQRSCTGTAYFLNVRKIFARLKRRGLRFERYIDFWEIRSCEAPLILGVREAYPGCTIYAYQHAALIPRLFLANYKTTPEEFAAAPHPDFGIANSRINRDFLKCEGFPPRFVQLGPSLRYMYLEEKSGGEPLAPGEGILVCLPMQLGSACEMLELLHDALAGEPPEEPVWIKPHPMMDLDLLKGTVSFKWPGFFLLVSGPMDQWLPRAQCVVVSDSAVMVESVFLGVRTLVLGKETGLDLIPLDVEPGNRQWEYIVSRSELIEALRTPAMQSSREGTGDYFEFDLGLIDEIMQMKRLPHEA